MSTKGKKNLKKKELHSPNDVEPTSTSTSSNKKQIYESALDQLKKYSRIVADTGEFSLLSKYNPEDATTNPSLIYKASQLPEYQHLITDVIVTWKKKNISNTIDDEKKLIEILYDRIIVNFGCEILKHVKGRVSTEVDARYSFDTKRTIERAHNIIKYYEEKGISKNRVLIKIASTWEGIEACKILTKEGIHCNMTLIFALPQAIAAAEAKAALISPFVGRILDWYKTHDKEYAAKEYEAKTDPGIISVKEIYYYYKKFGYTTTIMGASFRNAKEILELSGCDRLTISPQLLEELSNMKTILVEEKLKMDEANNKCNIKMKKYYDESQWRFDMNENQMATEKLSEGIRGFVSDGDKLAAIIKTKLNETK